jgi:hypothetical protein
VCTLNSGARNGEPGDRRRRAPEYLEAARKAMTDEQQFRAFEAEVRSLYELMARITIAPEWAKVLDFETRLPSAVEELLSPDDSAGSWMG